MRIRNAFQLIAIALTGALSAVAQNAALTGFVDSHGVERVFYEDALQNIQELDNSGSWSLAVPGPTEQSGGPPTIAGSALTSFYDSFGIQHVFYFDATLNVRELYNNGRWWPNQLTGGTLNPRTGLPVGAATNAPPARDSLSIASCFDSRNVEHVFYIDSSSHVRELFNNGQWGTHDITAQTETPTATDGSPLTSFCDSSGNVNVFTELVPSTTNIEWFHVNVGSWVALNLTAATDGPSPLFPNVLTSFFDSFGIGHVFYFDTKQNVQELYNVNGLWSGNDPTTKTNSPSAETFSALTSFFDTNRIEHVFYFDSNLHVRELYNDGQWETNDLTARTNCPTMARVSALGSFFDTQGEHVFYVDGADHIIQLSFNGNWLSTDLTAITGSPLATP
jgi:hypothetical protein